MFPLAYLTPLWFRVMDRRLVQAVGRNPDRIHFEPSRRAQLMARHGLVGLGQHASAPSGSQSPL